MEVGPDRPRDVNFRMFHLAFGGEFFLRLWCPNSSTICIFVCKNDFCGKDRVPETDLENPLHEHSKIVSTTKEWCIKHSVIGERFMKFTFA